MVVHPWQLYTPKLVQTILYPKHEGMLEARLGMRLLIGEEGSVSLGNYLYLTLLVDEEDGMVVDAKFKMIGETALVGAADILCSLVIGKTYTQAVRVTADMIDQKVGGGFPEETYPHINLALSALEDACAQASDIPVSITTPLSQEVLSSGQYPDWEKMTLGERLSLIEAIIESEVRPYIELDEGGITIVSLEALTLKIAYQGSCTTCPSSFGSTLHSIEHILRMKVHPTLSVVPVLESLQSPQ